MNGARGRVRGFTLIELIVVIAIIGILATITVLGLGRYQAQTRDAQRASSATVIAEALEKYYDANGEYPSCAAITGDATTVSTTLQGIDTKTLVAPQAPASDTNSIKCTSAGNTLTINGADFFEYQGDGSPECGGSGSCLSFILKYKDETDSQIKSIASRRSTSIATSGVITNLTANSTSFTTIALTWGSVNNAASYDIQTSTDIGFVANLVASTSPTNTATVGNLTPQTAYYFRVRPVSGSGEKGSWSNTATATTRSLATPTITAAVNSGTQITVSWPTVPFATSYKVQRSLSNTFPTGSTTLETTQAAGTGTQAKVYTDEAPGQTHYYRVQAIASGDISDWSAIVAMAPAVIPAPFTITKTDPQYNIEHVTSNAICTSGTTPYYKWFKNGVAWTEGTGPSYKTVDAVFPQWDYTLTVTNQVRCQTTTYQSPFVNASNNVSRTLSAPWVEIQNDQFRSMSWDGTCPAGTTSARFDWSISGTVNKSGSTGSNGRYTNTGIGWGSGRGYVTLHCMASAPYGWGDITASAQGGFGPGCLPMTGSCPP